MAIRTQDALYAGIDLELSWSEEALPQAERTKHVHALHPYLGKYVPQLVEAFIDRYFKPGECVYDPFAGSGTTLVEANAAGLDSVGCDISAFNCLLARVKTARHRLAPLELALRGALEESRRGGGTTSLEGASEWARAWYSTRALGELLSYRAAIDRLDDDARDVGRVVLSRAARSARLTTHFDLDFPKRPCLEPYFCYKHRRICRPVQEAAKFLRRYTEDTVRRLRSFERLRTRRSVDVLHGDSRVVDILRVPDGVITSPPYPGLIDYHEQHRYAYELLGLDDRRELEIGPAARGRARSALVDYVTSMSKALTRCRTALSPFAPVVVVVNDSYGLYPEILERSGLELERRLTRHVNRRTGLRAGEFYEDVLVCRT